METEATAFVALACEMVVDGNRGCASNWFWRKGLLEEIGNNNCKNKRQKNDDESHFFCL